MAVTSCGSPARAGTQNLTWKSKRVEDSVRARRRFLPPLDQRIEQPDWLVDLADATALGIQCSQPGRQIAERRGSARSVRALGSTARQTPGATTAQQRSGPLAAVVCRRAVYGSALDKAGMTNANPMWARVTEVAKQTKVRVTEIKYEPKIESPRAAVKEYSNKPPERHSLFGKNTRASGNRHGCHACACQHALMAHGNVDQIRKLPESDQSIACNSAFLNSPLAKAVGTVDLRRELDQKRG